MTDERIKEEYEKWAVNPYSQEEVNFAFTTCETNERKASFYAGFRTAERLAKIEVLESAKIKARECYFPQYVYKFLDDMIAELKEPTE